MEAWRRSASFPAKKFREKYNGFTMEKAHQLQCKSLRGRAKNHRRKKQWKTMKKTMRRTMETLGYPSAC
jgi:hypothetical protein